MQEQIRFINENEVSIMTGLSVQTLRNRRFLGKGFVYYKTGRSVRYRYDEILAFMEAGKIMPRKVAS